MRAPVDHAVAAVNQPFFVKTGEHVQHGFGTALVHRKAFALPVAGAAELFQLADNAVAVGILPGPGALQKAFTPQHLFGQALFLHLRHDLGLGGNGSVVGAGHPQSGIALHALVADQDILPGLVHRMAHVQLAGDVGRRHDDGERPLAAVDLGVEIPFIAPGLVDPVLGAFGVVLFGKFFGHGFLLLNAAGQNKSRPVRDVSWDGVKSPRYHPNCPAAQNLAGRKAT